jgi:hypothetical protein
MKKLVLAAVATMSLLSFAGQAPAAKKVEAKPVATAPAKTIAAAPAKTELKKDEKKEIVAAPADTNSPTTVKTEEAKPVETKKPVAKKK